MIKNDMDSKGESGPVVALPKKVTFLDQLTRDRNLLRLFVIMVVIFVAMSIANPSTFPTIENFQSMSAQFPEFGILAIAIMITMLTGGIDLSIVGTANLASIMIAYTVTKLVPPDAAGAPVIFGIGAALLLAALIGTICGLINGFLIARIGITPILATLGTGTLYTGLGVVITGGTSFFAVPQYLPIGGNILGLPVPLLIFVVIAAIFSLILNKTAFGYRIYMLGTNPKAAYFSGIDNANVLIRVYWLSGLLACTAGMIFLARTNSAKYDYGVSYVLLTVLICILGGVSYTGGFGKISGLVLAILSLQFLSTGLNMLLVTYSGSNFFREFAWGALLLIVMVINYFSNKRQSRGAIK